MEKLPAQKPGGLYKTNLDGGQDFVEALRPVPFGAKRTGFAGETRSQLDFPAPTIAEFPYDTRIHFLLPERLCRPSPFL
jgi:hypothetical protein